MERSRAPRTKLIEGLCLSYAHIYSNDSSVGQQALPLTWTKQALSKYRF